MGLEKKNTTFRFSEETLMELHQLQKVLWPFAEDRSSTLRIVIKIMYALIFTPATLRDALDLLQLIHRNTLQDSQLPLKFPPSSGGPLLRPRFALRAEEVQ